MQTKIFNKIAPKQRNSKKQIKGWASQGFSVTGATTQEQVNNRIRPEPKSGRIGMRRHIGYGA
jgi:hypothetical protein